MRIATWNVKAATSRAYDIASAIGELESDIVAVTEFRMSRQRTNLLDALSAGGMTNAVHLSPPPAVSSVLLASRVPLDQGDLVGHHLAPHRMVHARIPGAGIDVLAVYIQSVTPGTKTEKRTESHAIRDLLREHAQSLLDRPAILLGDLNTGQPGVDCVQGQFKPGNTYDQLRHLGWVDAFRHLHGNVAQFSHWQRRPKLGGFNGFRLDHAFVTPSLVSRLVSATYLSSTPNYTLVNDPSASATGPSSGTGGALSDHAALVVELADS